MSSRRIKRNAKRRVAKRTNGRNIIEGFRTATGTYHASSLDSLIPLMEHSIKTVPVSNGVDASVSMNHCKATARLSGDPVACFVVWRHPNTDELQVVAHYIALDGDTVIDPAFAVRGGKFLYLIVPGEVLEELH